MNLKLIVVITIAVAAIGGAVFLFSNSDGATDNNVAMVDGKQVITIKAKGGYLPRVTVAKANVPTQISVETQGTFDCSTALRIPQIGYQENLPPSGKTLIDIPAQPAGTNLQGVCSMGMFSFAIQFN